MLLGMIEYSMFLKPFLMEYLFRPGLQDVMIELLRVGSIWQDNLTSAEFVP